MPALTTTDQFLEVLRKSKLVDEARLDAFLRSPPVPLPEKPQQLALLLLRQGFITHFQGQQLLSGKWRGFLVANGKYKLLELLGVGGMGKVYLCEHVRMKRLVALKILPTDKIKEEESSLHRFEREARASAALDHPNIVRAHDLDTDPTTNLHFLVMEYVDGLNLQEIVKKHGPMDVVRTAHYVSQAAEGLQHAHEAGWIHRDIKPANLLLDRTGAIKILDMGLARFFHDDGSAGLTKKFDKATTLGTADYLAPEQAVDSSAVDIRADIYGLGATFYFMLTGHGPFNEGSIAQKLIWHQTRAPEPVSKLRPEVPAELEAVLAKMMAKKVAERYQEPHDVVEALRPWAETPIEPPIDTEMPRLCPALETYSLSGTSLPATGGPLSSARLRAARSGPRSGNKPRSSGRIPAAPPAAPAPARRKALLIAVGAGAAALFLSILGLAYWLTQPGPPPTTTGKSGPPGIKGANPDEHKDGPPAVAERLPPAAPGQWLVTRNPNLASATRPDVLTTVTHALERAANKTEQTILILDSQIEERVQIIGEHVPPFDGPGVGSHAGVRLASGLPGGRPVVWRPPQDDQTTSILTLRDAAGVQVRGFVFDGRVRTDGLIHVSGHCPGLTFEDLHLTDAVEMPMSIEASAQKDRPITLERVRITTVRDYHEGASLVKERNATLVRRAAVFCIGPQGGDLNLLVRNCRIEGLFQTGLDLRGPVNAEVRLCRFYTLRDDQRPSNVAVSDAVYAFPRHEPVRLRLLSNTIANYTNLLRIGTPLKTGADSTFLLRSNLMVGGKALVVNGGAAGAAAYKPLFAGSAGNVARPQDANQGMPVIDKTAVDFQSVELNPTSDRFLRYRRTGDTLPLLTAGADGEPAGVPPLD